MIEGQRGEWSLGVLPQCTTWAGDTGQQDFSVGELKSGSNIGVELIELR